MSMEESEVLEGLSQAVQKGRAKQVLTLIDEGLAAGLTGPQMLNDGLLHGLSLLGVRFKNNEVFVPEVLVAARALNKGSNKLKPYLTEEDSQSKGLAIIGTVKGDLHDIGKNLVRLMVEGAGFDMIDLGIDVPDEKFVEEVREKKPKILLLSALLTTTMGQVGSVINAINDAGLRDTVKIMVGGAPLTQEFADEIGADGYSEDASSAADLAVRLAAEKDAEKDAVLAS